MTEKITFFLILVLFIPVLSAQTPGETILESYERNFIRSSLNTKVNVLSDAALDEAAAEFYGPLCEIALNFVLNNASLFRDDPDILSITVAAVRGVGEYEHNRAVETLWQVFLRFPDKAIRYEILAVLPVLETSSLTGKIHEFLIEQNHLYKSGISADSELLLPLFSILGKTEDESSYQFLFESIGLYTGDLREEAVKALYEIDGNLFDFFLRVILEDQPPEKLSAFNLALAWEGLSEEETGKMAEAALDLALAVPGDRRSEILELAERSLFIIKETGWVRALPQVLKYYNQSFTAFRSNITQKHPLINAINCLGNLKSADAAQTLVLQLGLYNSRYAALQAEENEVVLALINALGQLGYKASYDVLHYASILSYPDDITEAAQNALAKLKW